jgi:hypothetical protein
MAISREERITRKYGHTKQERLQVEVGLPEVSQMREGVPILRSTNEGVTEYIRYNSALWRNNFTRDDDKVFIVDELKYKKKFTDYRYIIHNFSRDIGTDKIYIPWFGITENISMDNVSSAMLAPFKMTLYKLYIRPATLTGATADLALGLDKQDDGDVTVDSIATFTYTTTLGSNTLITINQSDWSAAPIVEAGDKVGIFIDASIDPSSTIVWYITSVWKVEVVI